MTGDWRADQTAVLYAFMLKFKKLPSEVYEEDPVVMSNLLHVFYEDMQAQEKALKEIEAKAGK